MTNDHHAHLDRVLERLTKDLRAKYCAGQEEHDGRLWEQRVALDLWAELIDAIIYTATLLEQIERRHYPL